jgi:CDP-glucose 4,6-dehydratase
LLTKSNVKIKRIEEKREAEIKAQYVSSKKANRLLEWSAKVSLDEGLKRSIAWYSEFL